MTLSLHAAGRTLQLVRPTLAYLAGLEALLNDPLVAERLGGRRSRSSIIELINKDDAHWDRHGFGPWLLVEPNSPEVFGRGGIRYADVLGKREVELCYSIRPSCWREGLGSFIVRSALHLGFDEAHLLSIVAFTTPHNEGSLRLLEKFAFAKEAEFEHAGLPHILFRLASTDWKRG